MDKVLITKVSMLSSDDFEKQLNSFFKDGYVIKFTERIEQSYIVYLTKNST